MNSESKHFIKLVDSVVDYFMEHMEIIECYASEKYQVVNFTFKEEYVEMEIWPENGDHNFYYKENGLLEKIIAKDKDKVSSILFLAVLVKTGEIESVNNFLQQGMEKAYCKIMQE